MSSLHIESHSRSSCGYSIRWTTRVTLIGFMSSSVSSYTLAGMFLMQATLRQALIVIVTVARTRDIT
jgi:hypothetical protein